MLTEQDLLRLLPDLESDQVERTESTSDTDKFAQAICAFSNDFPNHRAPGFLLIGIDKHGTPTGLKVTDQLLQNIAGIRSDGNVQPLPAMVVYKITLSGGKGDIAVAEVLPSDLPPVRYKGQIWIRVGPRRGIANETEERILSERRTCFSQSFDTRPCRDSKIDDLELALFTLTYRPNAIAPEIILANNRDIKEQLASLRFFELGKDCPTNAGILLFGKEPLQRLPGASIQFVRFNGEQLTSDVLYDNTFSGDLITLLRELDSFIPINLQSRPEGDSPFHERTVVDYPIVAIRELLMNAIMHRLYDSNTPIRFYWFTNRIEIQSPGGLYGEATPENFPRQNSYRNPVIAEAMKILGYVNKYGRGVYRAQEALKQNGNPEAQFEFLPTFVLATIWR